MRYRSIVLLLVTAVVTSAAWGQSSAGAVRKPRCPVCLNTGRQACPDCKVLGKPTGKTTCGDCGGKRRITCPECNGTRGGQCPGCGGAGRTRTGTETEFGGVFRQSIYEPCSRCAGTGMIHWYRNRRQDDYERSGPCSNCNQKKLAARLHGTVACGTCRGSGYSGPCPSCAGKRTVACTRCQVAATAEPAARPAAGEAAPKPARPTTQPALPRIPADLKLATAQTAAKAYAQGIDRAERTYREGIRRLREQRVREITATLDKTIKQLNAAMTEATQGGDLDEAIKIRDFSRELQAAIKRAAPSAPQRPQQAGRPPAIAPTNE